MDLRVFVDADPDLTRERVARRHVGTGIEETMESVYGRVDENDGVNGALVRERLCGGADVVVRSVDVEMEGVGVGV